jgi:hypothetical protein
VRPSDIVCLEFCVAVCHPSWKIILANSEMTDMVLCYGSADGVGLRAQALYREEILAVQGLRENGTFQRRSVDRCQELTSRMLDLESQILETVEENCQQIPGSCSQHTNFMGKRINILLQNFFQVP